MKAKLKKSLKLDKRAIRKLDVRSGLQGGRNGGGQVTVVDCVPDSYECLTVISCPTSRKGQ